MMNYPHIAQRLFNCCLAIHPGKAEVIVRALSDRFSIAGMDYAGERPLVIKPLAYDEFEDDDFSSEFDERGYDVVNGVAIVPVCGTLVQKTSHLRVYSGLLGYNAIRHNFLTALDDPAVKAIVLDVDSPGGEVAGCFDLVDTIYRARAEKPILSILTESAYSAAYAIASAAEQIAVPRTGGTGSVGVICCHADLSGALDKAGVNVTIIQYGARKSDGTDSKPLSSEALARFQADVDSMGELFVETVARNRGMTTTAVRKTEASTYLGASGVEIGFADAVMAPDEAFRSLLAELG